MPEQPQPYEVGDRIEHLLVPGFWMTVLDTKDCETPDHRAYKIVDFTGHEDWLCAYDVRREGEESPDSAIRDNVRLAVAPGQLSGQAAEMMWPDDQVS